MPYRDVIADSSPGAADGPTLWIGALSFEERCTASLEALVASGQPPAVAMLLEYPTAVHPVGQDRERRQRSRARVSKAVNASGARTRLATVDLDPYSHRAAQRAVLACVESLRPARIVVDVSCLTKIHAIAVADPRVFARDVDWSMAYTTPETYGHLDASSMPGAGWRDVLVLPVGEPGGLRNESKTRGVILAGHEGDRLVIALAEVEPSAGLIVTARTDGRPDLRREALRRNEQITRLLTSRGGGDRWAQEVVSLRHPEHLAGLLDAEIARAAAADAPVMLYPFGPKPFVALAAMQMASTRNLAGWFVYPIPNGYDVDYSYGVGETTWYRKAARLGVEQLAIGETG